MGSVRVTCSLHCICLEVRKYKNQGWDKTGHFRHFCLFTGEGDAFPNASCLHLTIAISGVRCEESVWHSWRCLLEAAACGLLQAAEAQLPSFVLAFKQVLSLVWSDPLWTQKQQRTVILSSWYSSYCAACFPASYSLHSFPKRLQTGRIYLRNIVSRIISVLLTFSQSWETYQLSCSALPSITSACVRPTYCQPSLGCSCAIITSPFPTAVFSRLLPAPFPQQPQLVSLLSPSRRRSHCASFPRGWAQPGAP